MPEPKNITIEEYAPIYKKATPINSFEIFRNKTCLVVEHHFDSNNPSNTSFDSQDYPTYCSHNVTTHAEISVYYVAKEKTYSATAPFLTILIKNKEFKPIEIPRKFFMPKRVLQSINVDMESALNSAIHIAIQAAIQSEFEHERSKTLAEQHLAIAHHLSTQKSLFPAKEDARLLV